MRVATRFLSAGVAAALTAGGLLCAAPPASAVPVFAPGANLVGGSGAGTGGPGCSASVTPPAVPPVEMVENGPAASMTVSGTADFVKAGDPTDTGHAVATVSATGSITSSGGSMRSIELVGSGTGSVTEALGTSACQRWANTSVELNATFTLAEAGIVTLSGSGDGGLSAIAQVYRQGLSTVNENVVLSAGNFPTSSAVRIFLTPGTYVTFAQISLQTGGGKVSAQFSGQGRLRVSFAPSGSQSRAAAGKGGKYVAMPAARSCASHTLLPVVTTSKKRAAKIKRIDVFAGTQRVAKVKKAAAGQSINVPLPDDTDADVTVQVTLRAKKGHKPKVLKVSAAYTACTV